MSTVVHQTHAAIGQLIAGVSFGSMDDLRFYVLSYIRTFFWDDNERLCTVELRLRLTKFPPQSGLEPWTARSVGHRLIY